MCTVNKVHYPFAGTNHHHVSMYYTTSFLSGYITEYLTGGKHHVQQVYEEIGIRAHDQVGLLADVLKLNPALTFLSVFSTTQCIHEIWCQNELDSFAPNAEFGLPVSQKMPEVDVKELARFLHHDVVVMAIPNAQHIRRNTVSCTWPVKTRVTRVTWRIEPWLAIMWVKGFAWRILGKVFLSVLRAFLKVSHPFVSET